MKEILERVPEQDQNFKIDIDFELGKFYGKKVFLQESSEFTELKPSDSLSDDFIENTFLNDFITL